MSDRIVESLNEMKQIYLESVSGLVISERDEYLQYIEEKNKKMKNNDEDEKEEEDDDKKEDEDDKPKRWWDDDGDGIGYEKGEEGEVSGKFKKKKKMDESFVDWRSELYEKVGDVEADIEDSKRQIKERSNIKNTVEINPNINIGESVELSEEYIEDVIDIAAEYFYEQGLNEQGLQMVIEDLGIDKFLEYVFCISEDFMLTEERAARRRPKGSKSYAEIKAEIDAKEKAKAAKKKPTVAQKVTVSRGEESVKKAVATQPKSRPVLDALARGIMGAAKTASTQYQQGMQRHRQAMSTAQKTAKTAGKVVSTASKAASEIGSGMRAPMETPAGRKVQAALIKGARRATKAAVNAAARETAKRRVGVKEEIEAFLQEKAESEQQQKLFGLALSVKRGETPRSEASKEVLEIVDGMSEAKIRKFAKTKHKGLPRKKED